jgi:hypothetical protein
MIMDSDDEEEGVKSEEAERDAEWDDERALEWCHIKVEITRRTLRIACPRGTLVPVLPFILTIICRGVRMPIHRKRGPGQSRQAQEEGPLRAL